MTKTGIVWLLVVIFVFYIVENTVNKCMRKKMRIKWKLTKLSQNKGRR